MIADQSAVMRLKSKGQYCSFHLCMKHVRANPSLTRAECIFLFDALYSLVVRVLDSRLYGLEFDSRPRRLRMGNRLRAGKPPIVFHQVTQANSASYPPRDGK